MMKSNLRVFLTVALFLSLNNINGYKCQKNNQKNLGQWSNGLVEINEEIVPHFIESVDTALLYFHRSGDTSTNDARFLRHLENAAKHLHAQDYGVLIAKVNCSKKLSTGFCSNSEINENVYIFRNGRKIILSRDSLPDDQAIAASLMHIDLIEKVPILKSMSERKALEKKYLGHMDILLIYVPYLGGYEHRVFMEITYSFLDQYLCALTTSLQVTDDLVKPPYAEEDSSDAEREALLWVLSCRNESNSCQKNIHRGAIHLEGVARFLAASQLPKWSDSRVEDGELRSVYDEPEIDIPVLYVIYTAQDKESAFRGTRYVSAVFRGSVGVALFPREDLPLHSLNNDWKRVVGKSSNNFIFQEESRVQKWSFPTVNGAVDFMKDYLEEKRKIIMGKLREMKTEEFEEVIPQLIQDDPIALAVQQIGKPDWMIVTTTLTEESFPKLQDSKRDLFVLYYLPWEPVSQLVIHMINAISTRLRLGLEDHKETLVAKMDCYDWTYFCRDKNIFTFPTFVLYQNSSVIAYREVYEKSALQSFIIKHRKQQTNDNKTKLCDKNDMIVKNIPEITVNSFHSLVKRGQPLAVLIGNRIGQTRKNFDIVKTLVAKNNLQATFCWLDSESGLGEKVARFYNLTNDEEPVILFIREKQLGVHNYSGKWTEKEIELWIDKVSKQEIPPTMFKSDKKWTPLQKDFNFLAKMEEEEGEEKISMDADISVDIFREDSIPNISQNVKSRRRPVSPIRARSPIKHKEL